MAQKTMAIIATQGTLDGVYPPFILASTAAALGFDVRVFFTFYGLQLLKKKLRLRVSALGNPALPMPLGMDKWFPVAGLAIPGMEALMTAMMQAKIKKKGIASIEELRALCLEAGVTLIACEMTVDLFDIKRTELIDGIQHAGAASFLEFAGGADISLFI